MKQSKNTNRKLIDAWRGLSRYVRPSETCDAERQDAMMWETKGLALERKCAIARGDRKAVMEAERQAVANITAGLASGTLVLFPDPKTGVSGLQKLAVKLTGWTRCGGGRKPHPSFTFGA